MGTISPDLCNQEQLNIGDIGAGSPGAQQIARRFERCVAVVVVQHLLGIQFAVLDPCRGAVIDNSSGRIGRAVAAVGASAQKTQSLRIYWASNAKRSASS